MKNVADVTLNIQAVFQETYAKGEYAQRINYKSPCSPPLSREDGAWAKQLIRAAKSNGRGRKKTK